MMVKPLLKVTWNVELKDDLIDTLLVTLLDVTEKTLEAEAISEEGIEKIHQLINISPEKAAQFFGTSEPLLAESKSILGRCKTDECLDDNTLKILFINAHTVSAARTLHLSELELISII